MNIGETIYKLRSEKNMSQGDLADMLDVSRQSVSKWETNQSVPDLDKIIKLSKIFEVTLDEFVLGEKKVTEAANTAPEHNEPEKIVIVKETVVEAAATAKGQKTAGIVLFCMAFVVMLAFALMGGIPEGIILALPFLICGFICVFAKKNAGLWCAWVVYFLFDSYTIWAIGVNSWRGFARNFIHYGGKMTVGDIMALIQLVVMFILIVVTIIRFKDRPVSTSRGALGLIVVGWVVLLLVTPSEIMLFKLLYGHGSMFRIIGLITKLFDWCELLLFVVVLIYTVRFIKSRKSNA